MQTVILAAGEGTRMRPLTDRRPKPMLPVGDRPIAAHTADAAVEAGASRLVLVVGYEREAVESHFGSEYRGIPVEYRVQKRQRGTADAVRVASDALSADPFVVLNGDALYDPDSLATLYDRTPAVAAYRVENPGQYGVLTTEGDRITGVVEKPEDPETDLINAGAYALPAAAQSMLDVEESERGEAELTDVLAAVCRDHHVDRVPLDRWLDVGRPWELLEANEWKVSERERRIDGEVHEDADLRGAVVVEEGAAVEAGVVIEGPAMIRAGAEVGPNAYLRGTTLVGEGAEVGHAVEVKNSVLMEGATVPHLSYVGDSVLGRDVNLGADTTVANLRHDDADVRLTVKGDRVSTGRRKFGVVVGDGAKTGIGVDLNAGVTLSTDAAVPPGETVTRDR
jgi:UDP-N-acetylglucosamine diphosphorylase/glucosamine-1-phosphate N-acetyltransferase